MWRSEILLSSKLGIYRSANPPLVVRVTWVVGTWVVGSVVPPNQLTTQHLGVTLLPWNNVTHHSIEKLCQSFAELLSGIPKQNFFMYYKLPHCAEEEERLCWKSLRARTFQPMQSYVVQSLSSNDDTYHLSIMIILSDPVVMGTLVRTEPVVTGTLLRTDRSG